MKFISTQVEHIMKNATLAVDPGKSLVGPFVNIFGDTQCVISPEDVIKENITLINLFLHNLRVQERKSLAVENVTTQTTLLRNEAILARHKLEMALQGYRTTIDLRFLSAKDSRGLPIFGIAEIKPKSLLQALRPTPTIFSMTVDNNRGHAQVRFSPPNLPPEIQELYLGTAMEMAKVCERNEEIFICAEYTGSMPDELRDVVELALKSRLFESLWLIFEAPKWIIGKRMILRPDPVIVARDLSLGFPVYFYLGIFDPTRHELLAVENFAQNNTPR